MKNKVPLYLINKYQKATENKEHRCRYFPSCSQYAKECYEKERKEASKQKVTVIVIDNEDEKYKYETKLQHYE